MDKHTFLQELEQCLQGISKEEREEAISYYRAQNASKEQTALVNLLREIQQQLGSIPSYAVTQIAQAYSLKESYLLALIKRIPSLRLENTHCLQLCAGPNCGKHTALAALCGGLCLFIASGLQQYGTTLTRDPGKAGFITGLYTVMTPILYFLIFRRKTGWNTWIGCVLATVGLYLLCLREGQGSAFGVGELVLLLGSVFWAGHIILVDRFIDHISPLRFASWQFCISSILGFLTGAILETPTLDGVWNARWAILFCGVLSVGVAFTPSNSQVSCLL